MVIESEKDMQQSLATFNEMLKRYLMKINIKKTKVMVVTVSKKSPSLKYNWITEQLIKYNNIHI